MRIYIYRHCCQRKMEKNIAKIDGTKFNKGIPCHKIPLKDCRVKVITKSDYEYFRTRALEGLSMDEKKNTSLMEAEQKRERLLAESLSRKQYIRQLDMQKLKLNVDKSKKLNESETEARERTIYLNERANKLKLEQEEEIQMCNKLILETKCRAIRDMQVAEKKLIEMEMNEEEKRLDDMMENERRRNVQEENKKNEEQVIRRQTFARLLKNQIEQNEEQRIIDFERKQEEGRLINISNIAWQDEEMIKAAKKKEERELIRREIIEENEKLIKFKDIEREENKYLDMRIHEFRKKKQNEEEAHMKAQQQIKARKSREIDRIAKQTMNKYNVQAQIEELNAARVKEQVEREWRRREKEEAMKKFETRQMFDKARQEQINCRKTLQAIEIERDKREFEEILKAQKEALYREQKQREERHLESVRHRSEILKQINEKEKTKIEVRRKTFEEGLAIRAQSKIRANQLREVMERKCQEMRENKVPEIYINEVKNTFNDKNKLF